MSSSSGKRRAQRQSDQANESLSPAQRYAAFKKQKAYRATAASQFAQSLPFELDDFQKQAIDALENGNNVLVAAPTGAGKTVIADFAMFLAQNRNVKAFYTTPIKALSNQKYHDLVDLYGSDRVGLLTGDISVNSEADIVVMTTEVLRNMLYEHSSTLNALRYVILDEVHYLADRFRGPVWEEVIIHLPSSVRIVGLSATVSNVEDFSQWIASVRGDTKLVVSEHRPVPLEQHVLVQADENSEPELYDLYRHDNNGKQTDKLNAQLASRLDQLDRQALRRRAQHASSYGRKSGKRHVERQHPVRYMPRRWAVVDELQYLDMLPGIFFIFSRNGCDRAVEQCINAGLELTSHEESLKIRQIVDEMVEGQMSKDDLKALHFSQFRFALEEGFAAHHAGMIALYRHIVERLFSEGLVKVVFATETLALGINMPARSVVVEKLEKYDGTGHVGLTPGEFTQLTGRAGRRGIDSIGHAVVVDHRDFVPATAAALSSKRVYPLHSSFKPTFNMAVNLLNSSDYETARITLDHSFAQWEANASAWQLESQMTTLEQALQGYEQAFACEYGDFAQLLKIRMELSEEQKDERKRIKHRVFATESERKQAFKELDERIARLREQDANHPCRQCPDLQQHMVWGHRWTREYKELRRIRHRFASRTGSVARQFDGICGILHDFGYLSISVQNKASEKPESHGTVSALGNIVERRQSKDYQLTEHGQLLRRLYSEQDLVLAQAIYSGVLDELTPVQLASTLSALVVESRRGGGGEPRHYPGGPEGAVAVAAQQMRRIHTQVNVLRDDTGLEELMPLDVSLVDVFYNWACGDDLSSVLRNTELTGGDFVRNAKRLADVLQQIAVAKPYLGDHVELAEVAHEAEPLINRGVIAYTGIDFEQD